MDRIVQTDIADEPLGIIISSGSRAESAPRLSAYVWGPVPEDPEPRSSGSTIAA